MLIMPNNQEQRRKTGLMDQTQIISLKDFVLSGKFGKISIGMDKNRVIEYLGPPLEVKDFKNERFGLYYNGVRFLYTASNRIYAITCQNFDDVFSEKPKDRIFPISHTVQVDSYFFTISEKTNYRTVKDRLNAENIKFREQQDKFWDKIIFDSGVEFLFNNWCEYPEDDTYDKNELELCGFRNFPIHSKNN